MFESFLSISFEIIEINMIDISIKIEIDSLNLDWPESTSCCERVRPTPLPEALLKNMKTLVLLDYIWYYKNINKGISF